MPFLKKNNKRSCILIGQYGIRFGTVLMVVFCFLFTQIVFLTISAQSPFFHIKELSNSFNAADFNTFYEDHSGRIYLGGDTGLLFFDGQKLQTVPVEGDSLFSVTAIYQPQQKQLLVGTEQGYIYELKQGKLYPLQLEEGFPTVRITGFQEDSQQRLWFSTYGEGVYFLDHNRLYNIDEDDGLPGNDIYDIAAGVQGEIWLGTDGGISICSFQNGEKKIRHIAREDGLPDDIVRSIRRDSEGHFWVGMYDHGFCRFNTQTNKVDFVINEWNEGVVNDLELFAGQELWIGTEGNGLFRYLLSEKILTRVNDNIDFSKSRVKDLLKDMEGNIWVLDNVHKLACANKQFERLDVPMNHIQSLQMDQQQNLWLGSGQGLFRWKQGSAKTFTEVLKNVKPNVTSLFEDKFGNLWVGTFGDGVYIYNPDSKKVNHFSERDGLTNNSVLSIDGVNEHMWLATLGGVTEVSMKKNPLHHEQMITRNFNQSNGLGTNFIYKVFIDSQARVWFGTDGKGLSVLENGSIKNFREIIVTNQNRADSIELKTIYCITEDYEGHIWFSTAQHGLFEFDGANFKQLPLKEDLSQVTVTSLVSDNHKDILVVYPSGVAILDPAQHHLIYYDHEVGLKDIDPNLNAGTCDGHGNIWFADQSQLIKYVSLQEPLEIHPRTILDELIVNYQPVDFAENPAYNYDQNNFVFRYIGLWYTAPDKVRYKYRLNGYDPDWIYSKDNQVSYSSLPSGDYVFEVTSTENDAFDEELVVTYAFSVSKPFWRQSWFVFGSILLFFAGVYAFIKIRDQRKQRVSELQKEKLSSQLEAIKAQINPHFLFNSFNTLATLIDENQEAAVEYVEHLSDFYRSMLQYRNMELIPIQEEIKLVKDYTFLLKKRFGDNFNISVNVNANPAQIVPLSLQTLVENAVKHNIISKAKPLEVHIDIEDNNYVTVTNNIQKKLHPERSTGFGLQSLKRQYELLGLKKIKIETTEKHFKVGLPLIK